MPHCFDLYYYYSFRLNSTLIDRIARAILNDGDQCGHGQLSSVVIILTQFIRPILLLNPQLSRDDPVTLTAPTAQVNFQPFAHLANSLDHGPWTTHLPAADACRDADAVRGT